MSLNQIRKTGQSLWNRLPTVRQINAYLPPSLWSEGRPDRPWHEDKGSR